MTAPCPSCGVALPEAAVRFCLACGHRLPAASDDTVPPHSADLWPPQRPGRAKPPPGRRNLVLGLVALVILAGGGTGAYVMLHHKSPASAGTGHDQNGASRTSS